MKSNPSWLSVLCRLPSCPLHAAYGRCGLNKISDFNSEPVMFRKSSKPTTMTWAPFRSRIGRIMCAQELKLRSVLLPGSRVKIVPVRCLSRLRALADWALVLRILVLVAIKTWYQLHPSRFRSMTRFKATLECQTEDSTKTLVGIPPKKKVKQIYLMLP
jgi:hypothetical protein